MSTKIGHDPVSSGLIMSKKLHYNLLIGVLSTSKVAFFRDPIVICPKYIVFLVKNRNILLTL